MNVLVDTSIWSEAFRRKEKWNHLIVQRLTSLIADDKVVLIGPVRQEILSGIKGQKQFEILKNYLRAFPDHTITTFDYEKAAEFFNICRRFGIQGSNTDFLICAVSVNNNFQIFTTDKDFENFFLHLPINLYK